MGAKNSKILGCITTDIAALVDFNYHGDVLVFNGVYKHIKKRHEGELPPEIIDNLESIIKDICSQPDYVGYHPKKKGESINFVKNINIKENLLLGIKVDLKKGYIFVSTLYPLTEAKINCKIHNGQLIKILKDQNIAVNQ